MPLQCRMSRRLVDELHPFNPARFMVFLWGSGHPAKGWGAKYGEGLCSRGLRRYRKGAWTQLDDAIGHLLGDLGEGGAHTP